MSNEKWNAQKSKKAVKQATIQRKLDRQRKFFDSNVDWNADPVLR